MYALSDPGRNLLTPRIIRASNASLMTLDGTRTYIVGWQSVLVIDPGPDDADHLDAVAAALRGAKKVDIVVTHHHDDHAGGVEGLISRLGKRPAPPSGSFRVQERLHLDEGAVIDTDAGRVTAVATPGHTPDHMAYVWKAEGDESAFGPGYDIEAEFARRRAGRSLVGRSPGGGGTGRGDPSLALFVGDLLLGEGDTTLVAYPEGDVGQYLASLEKVEAFRADRLFPAHGSVVTDPQGAISRYRAHRLSRVEQVRSALRTDPACTTAALVNRLYGAALPDELRSAAEGSVEAIRRYLAAG